MAFGCVVAVDRFGGVAGGDVTHDDGAVVTIDLTAGADCVEEEEATATGVSVCVCACVHTYFIVCLFDSLTITVGWTDR